MLHWKQIQTHEGVFSLQNHIHNSLGFQKVCYRNADIFGLLFRYMTKQCDTIFEIISGTNQMWDITAHIKHKLNSKMHTKFHTPTHNSHFSFSLKRWHKFMLIKLALTYCLISGVWFLNWTFFSYPSPQGAYNEFIVKLMFLLRIYAT